MLDIPASGMRISRGRPPLSRDELRRMSPCSEDSGGIPRSSRQSPKFVRPGRAASAGSGSARRARPLVLTEDAYAGALELRARDHEVDVGVALEAGHGG